MNCPVCDDRMRPVMRNGVEIDICPGCKGVWLDRGELDKLIAMENSGNYDQQRPAEFNNAAPRRDHDDHDRRDKHDSHDSHSSHDNRYDSRSGSGNQQKRKGSWLGDILGGIGGGDD